MVNAFASFHTFLNSKENCSSHESSQSASLKPASLALGHSVNENAELKANPTPLKTDPANRFCELTRSALNSCQKCFEQIDATRESWINTVYEILAPFNASIQAACQTHLGGVICKRITPAAELGKPTNKIAFPNSPELTLCLDWISRALLNPGRYQLESLPKDPANQDPTDHSVLSLKDLLTHEISTIVLPFSVDIVYQNNRLMHCILISRLCYGQGGFSSPPICWDALSGQSLVLKTERIAEVARPIIEQIAKERFSEAVPMLVFKEPYWRVYEQDCGKDLCHFLIQHRLNTELKLRFAKDLLEMLAKFHSRTYLIDNQTIPAFHGDLKPSNILCNNEFLLTDFGFTSPATLAGTPGYMSPEAVRLYEALIEQRTDTIDGEFNQYRQAQDVWAMGITLFQLVKGLYEKLPFAFDIKEFMSMSQETVDMELAKTKPEHLPQELKPVWTCIEKMLRVNPKERLSAKEAHELLLQAPLKARLRERMKA